MSLSLSDKLLDFFRREFDAEEQSDFARLARIPDSRVMAALSYYKSLNKSDRDAFKDCCAHWAHVCYGFVAGAPKLDHTKHPFFPRWSQSFWRQFWDPSRSVPCLRTKVQQYKIDKKRGVESTITLEEFVYASSVQSVKAPELRKRVRASLKPLGYQRIDELGFYCCKQADKEFRVHVDYGGSHAQLRYVVSSPEFRETHPLLQFRFERVLGFGQGDWDYIVAENVDEVFSLFPEVVAYSFELPDRIKTAVA